MVGSQRADARYRGVTHRAVQVAISSGRISTLPGGRVDFEQADKEADENTDIAMRPGDPPQIKQARTAWFMARGGLLQIEIAKRRGKFGFEALAKPERYMERHARDVYRGTKGPTLDRLR